MFSSALIQKGDTAGTSFFEGGSLAHLDLPRARQGGFAGGFFAMWSPNPGGPAKAIFDDDNCIDDEESIDAVSSDVARNSIFAQADLAQRMDAEDRFRICRNSVEIEEASEEDAIAALLHLEGAEGIGPELGELDTLYEMGLRSLGPVWSRPNDFGHGVPFQFDRTPDSGPGLTDSGKRLVRRCADLNMIIDLAHMNERGFWDVANIYDGTLVVTHSGVHALCPATRNLTGKQLDAIAERGGVVGLNFHAAFLRKDGRRTSKTPLETMIRHLDALINVLGEDGVSLGSDFDGALMPQDLKDSAHLPNLVAEMQRAGFGADLIDRICWSNWIHLIRRVIG